VNGRNILLSHLNQSRIDKEGGTYSLEEMINTELLFQKAGERRVLPTSLDLEKYIVRWKTMYQVGNLGAEEFEKYLQEKHKLLGGQFRNQLARMVAVGNLRNLEVSERIVITAGEVEKFYKKNPKYVDDRYSLKTRVIPFIKAKTVDEAAKVKGEKWIDVDWINASDLADRMLFVKKMKIGGTAALKVEQGHQFVRLVKKEEKRLKTVNERWGEIEKTLQDEKRGKFETEYLSELREKASIVYLDKKLLS